MRTLIAALISLLTCFFGVNGQVTRDMQREKTAVLTSTARTALVIGNSDYRIARSLPNSSNDAKDMAATLAGLGFDVISGTDLSLTSMKEKVREFGDKIKVYGGVGLFYYAGHGIQVGGRNYLVPVEADIQREDEIEDSAMNFDLVLRKMATANNGFNIVILDACRNNPFSRSWSRGTDEGGLAQITAPTGTFIAYATSPDRTASDGTGRNGLYTSELLKVMTDPNLKIEEAFKQVTIAVDRASGGKQVPWTSSSLRGEFYFKSNEINSKAVKQANDALPGIGEPQKTVSQPVAVNLSPDAVEWNRIKNTKNPYELSTFLQKYPGSPYAQQAATKLMEFSRNPLAALDGENMPVSGSNLVFVDGEKRVPLKVALTKQDYNMRAGVMGIGSGVKYVTALNGGRSQLRVGNNKPEFEYLLASESVNISDVLIVVKLKSSGDKREIQGMQKTFSGFKKEDTVPATFEEMPTVGGVQGKLYKIKFPGALSPGEYAIFFSQAAGGSSIFSGLQAAQGTFYDFGVDTHK